MSGRIGSAGQLVLIGDRWGDGGRGRERVIRKACFKHLILSHRTVGKFMLSKYDPIQLEKQMFTD